MPALSRFHITTSGRGRAPVVFSHGFGCDQAIWRFVAPAFEDDYKVILFNHVGARRANCAYYDSSRYGSLHGYADDVLLILEELDLQGVHFGGHSVSSMIGILAANRAPERFASLVLVAPSPCYLNHDDYHGGLDTAEVQGMLDYLDAHYVDSAHATAPTIMGNGNPEFADELGQSFCDTELSVAKQFARVTFLSDHRDDLHAVSVPSLILQCSEDVLAPPSVGRFMHSTMPGSRFTMLEATGHCPNLSAPAETIACIRPFLESIE